MASPRSEAAARGRDSTSPPRVGAAAVRRRPALLAAEGDDESESAAGKWGKLLFILGPFLVGALDTVHPEWFRGWF